MDDWKPHDDSAHNPKIDRSLREESLSKRCCMRCHYCVFVLLGLYVSIQNNITQLIDTWNKDVHISAYFDSTTTENERFIIRERIHALPEATQVRYVSEKAQEWFVSRVDGIEETLNTLGNGILPSSLESHSLEVSLVTHPKLKHLQAKSMAQDPNQTMALNGLNGSTPF